MTHPLDGLVDSILDRAATRGVFAELPDASELIGTARFETGPVDRAVRARRTVVVLRETLSRAEGDMRLFRSREAKAVKSEEISVLRMRLAAELQAMDRRA